MNRRSPGGDPDTMWYGTPYLHVVKNEGEVCNSNPSSSVFRGMRPFARRKKGSEEPEQDLLRSYPLVGVGMLLDQ